MAETTTPSPPSGLPPQRLLGPEDTLYFLHIPKAAGTTFRSFLENHFDADEICRYLVLEEAMARPPSELAKYRLISGHHGWFLHSLLARPPAVVTVLRDPVARTLSHFYHQRNLPQGNWLHDIIRDWTFERYVHDPLGVSEIVNFQVRHLALDRIQEDYWDHSPIRDRDLDALVAKYSDPRLLDKAVERLGSMAAFGLVERLDDTIRLVSHTFGWPPWSRPPRLNPRRSERDENDLTPAAVEQVKRLTGLDHRLYEHARGVFEARIAGLTPGAAAEAYSKAWATRPRIDSVRYGFDRALFGEGWYPRSLKVEGPINRWTGPTNAPYLDLPLSHERDLKIAFHAGAYRAEQVKSLRLLVNDQPVPLSYWQTKYGAETDGVFLGVIPRQALSRGNGYTRLRFEVSGTVKPCELDPGFTDKRTVALHFKWIEINPA